MKSQNFRRNIALGGLVLTMCVGDSFGQQGFRQSGPPMMMPLPNNQRAQIQTMPYVPGRLAIPRPDGSTLYQTPDIGGNRIQYHTPHFDPRNGLHRNLRVYNNGVPVYNAHIPAFNGTISTPPLMNPMVMDQLYKSLYNIIPEPARQGMAPSLFQQNGQF